MIDDVKYSELLDGYIKMYRREITWLEFKSNYQDAEHLGKYISSISNSACLAHQEFGYLFFGVDDNTLEIKGTTFQTDTVFAKGKQLLEPYLRLYITPKIDFRIEEFHYYGKERIVVFVIPAAVRETTDWMGIPRIRISSSVTDLRPYADWIRQIYNSGFDWTAQIVEDASLEDLDTEAIAKARKGYIQRNPDKAEECKSWDDPAFLDRAKLTKGGRITKTTLLLVGKEESVDKLGHNAQLVWKLNTKTETAGEIFTIPFVLTTSELMHKIRNYRFKIYRDDSLIPEELWKYDEEMVLEALHNCIAHQRMEADARIIVTETENDLTFLNTGDFFDGTFQDYILGTRTPQNYRNPFLARAMVNIKMIDTQGLGIHKLFKRQKERYLPLPDYDLSIPGKTSLKITGTVIDRDYSLLLIKKTDLPLETVYLLDQVQKHKPLSNEAVALLREQGLVEGRKNHLIIAKSVAQAVEREADYTKAKGFSKQFLLDLIQKALSEHGGLTKAKIDGLVFEYLPQDFTQEQKKWHVSNLLAALKKADKIFLDKGKVWKNVPIEE